jgi:hypothetical protein
MAATTPRDGKYMRDLLGNCTSSRQATVHMRMQQLVPGTSRCGSSSSCHSSRGMCPAATRHQLHLFGFCFSANSLSHILCFYASVYAVAGLWQWTAGHSSSSS